MIWRSSTHRSPSIAIALRCQAGWEPTSAKYQERSGGRRREDTFVPLWSASKLLMSKKCRGAPVGARRDVGVDDRWSAGSQPARNGEAHQDIERVGELERRIELECNCPRALLVGSARIPWDTPWHDVYGRPTRCSAGGAAGASNHTSSKSHGSESRSFPSGRYCRLAPLACKQLWSIRLARPSSSASMSGADIPDVARALASAPTAFVLVTTPRHDYP